MRPKPYVWRRPDPRGWLLAPVGWIILGAALLLSISDSPSVPTEVRVVIGFAGLAVLVFSGLWISGSHQAWSPFLTMGGAFAVCLGVLDHDPPGARIVCALIGLAIPGVAHLSGRVYQNCLPHLYGEPRIVRPSPRAKPDYGSWLVSTASELHHAPIVVLNRRSKQTAFELTDHRGQVLARVREIPHPRADDGMRAAFDFRNMAAPRYVIEVAALDGRPLFFIDGSEIQIDTAVPNGAGFHRAFAVVRPDGREIACCGGLLFDRVYADVMRDVGFKLDGLLYEWGQSMIVEAGNGTVPCSWATNRSKVRWRRTFHFTLLDADAATFAQLDFMTDIKVRHMIRFREQIPDNMRMLGIATLVVLGSERRKEVLPPDPAAPEPYPGFGDVHQAHYRRLRGFMDGLVAECRR
ncbi:hypothetical protein [Actinomadura decatromicini]|uniref:Uncharacterized protein n=1 Tax=Actinomadura decatromicini TaxID=2604572 RepID=A0A5D3F5X0_9ACTN|nr:hypothetical protein [Actinomadura decatromicini]TYK43711.1 hypothetical protein FXF68_36805 [Actinomadura decatromicini]